MHCTALGEKLRSTSRRESSKATDREQALVETEASEYYRLAPSGMAAITIAFSTFSDVAANYLLRRRKEEGIAYRKWTLPLVAAIGDEMRRFIEVKIILPAAC